MLSRSIDKKLRHSRQSTVMRVAFVDAATRQPGEGCSKLLRPGTPLYEYILAARKRVRHAGFRVDIRRAPHIEVLRPGECDDTAAAAQRAAALEAAPPLDAALDATWGFIDVGDRGTALVLYTGVVPGYGATHATVAFITPAVPLIHRAEVLRAARGN